MLRRLIFALVFMLSAQFAWAAVAPYCAHENAKAAFHLGHHVHEHGAEKQDEAQSAKHERVSDMDHPDCHQCHGSAVQFGTPGVGLHAVADGRIGPDGTQPSYLCPFHQGIDRPKWQRAA